MQKLVLASCLLLLSYISLVAQGHRKSTYDNIGWFNYFGTFNVSDDIGIHTEYQWRRTDYVVNWQQSLLRTGIDYRLTPNVLLRAGYAWIETFPYGEIPINGLGRDFTEHRFFQMIQLSQQESAVTLTHRFMLEQRFVGRFSDPKFDREDEFPLLHRVRYKLRVQTPLMENPQDGKSLYAAVYNELFIGFGSNVGANIFDQNRIGVLVGYRHSKDLRIEAGYLNQIMQLGRHVENSNVFQYNNGIIINAIFNFDLRGSK